MKKYSVSLTGETCEILDRLQAEYGENAPTTVHLALSLFERVAKLHANGHFLVIEYAKGERFNVPEVQP